MDSPIQTVEEATPATFRTENYLALNADVKKLAKRPGEARRHFQRHGQAEGRCQLSRAFTDDRLGRAKRKYDRFRRVLDASSGSGGRFRRLAGWRAALPLSYGGPSYRMSDYVQESANAGFHQFTGALNADPGGLYMDLGCGFRSVVYPNCLYVDVYPSLTADIVMEPACIYPFRDHAFDGIACLAVLEHVKQPWIVAKEIGRMLKPGGLAFVDWPFLQPVHGYPSHYYNATRAGVRELFAASFDILELDTLPNQTPDHAVSWLLRELSEAIADDALRADFLAMSVGDLLRITPGHGVWGRMVSALPDSTLERLACGNTMVARKRG